MLNILVSHVNKCVLSAPNSVYDSARCRSLRPSGSGGIPPSPKLTSILCDYS